MTAAFDPFEVLGVRRGATFDEIRTAYRQQVARYHPDKHRGNPLEDLAAAKLIEINRAYNLLSHDPAGVDDAPARRAPRPVAHPRADGGMKVVRSIGSIVALVLFARFGLVFGRQLLALVRGLAMGVLWIVRASPILAVLALIVFAIGSGFATWSRKGRG